MHFTRCLRFSTSLPRFGAVLGSAVVCLFAAGCATEAEPTVAVETTKYTLENTETFSLQDKAVLAAISCTGVQHYTLGDGRIEVIANLKNRSPKKLTIQTSCAFRDAQGTPLADETPWTTLTIAENTTETVRFPAGSPLAKKYTVRVREAR